MKYVPSLNTLRFLGAMSVIFLHLGSYQFFVDRGLERWHVLVSGVTGVALFFVLSGFLLTTLALAEVERTGTFSFSRFFTRRASRLFPLYFAAIAVLLILQLFRVVSISKGSYFYAIAYSYNFVPRADYTAHLGPFHTLSTEEHFYLFFGLVFMLVSLLGRKTVWIAIPALFLFLAIFLDFLRPLFASFEATHFVERWTPFAVKPILIGALGAFAYKSPIIRSRFSALFAGERSKKILALGFLFVFLGLYFSQVLQPNIVVLSIGFLCLFLALVINQRSWVSRVLSNRILVYFGTISYGLYVWAAVIIGTGPSSMLIASPPLAVATIFALSAFSYQFLEKWFLERRKQPRTPVS